MTAKLSNVLGGYIYPGLCVHCLTIIPS